MQSENLLRSDYGGYDSDDSGHGGRTSAPGQHYLPQNVGYIIIYSCGHSVSTIQIWFPCIHQVKTKVQQQHSFL